MIGSPKDFWGKLERTESGEVRAWHPLADHCADVAACALALLEATILRDRLARLASLGALDQGLIARLCVLAALHDIGKFNIGFQNKAFPGRGPTSGHVGPIIDLLDADVPERTKLLTALHADILLSWGAGVDALLAASICHHGRPIQPMSSPQLRHWQPRFGLDPVEGVTSLSKATARWFPEASRRDAAELPDEPAFQHAFSGLVMLADWLGSDRRLFPFSGPGDGERFTRSCAAAREALKEVGLDARPARGALGSAPLGFSAVSSFRPRPIQRALVESPVDRDRRLAVLEAETGSGKTEAALAWYLRLFQAGEVDSLYFALPTRTAATQLHRRVVHAVERAFPEKRPPVVLAVPGYLAVDDRTGRSLPGFEVLWNDDERARFRFRGWAAERPKRYLAGAIVVGTIDQLLLSALAVNHAHLRATASLRQLLVVDEVHASDAYMTRLIEAVMQRHLRAGGWALLMSATLGTHAFTGFARAAGLARETPNLQEAIHRPFPSIVHIGAPGAPRSLAPGNDASPKRVNVSIVATASSPSDVAEVAVGAAILGAKVLILRNTVRDCVATQRAVEEMAESREAADVLFRCAGVPAPHHARFGQPDRRALDEALEGVFGPEAASRGCVAVATQTVQQSLDIDADWLLTDLCPMDVLLQRLGRLHRHAARPRPRGFEEPRLAVVVPSERDLSPLLRPNGKAFGDHGFGTVYEDLRVLEATWRALEEHDCIEIPAMNRLLVERATHPEALAAVVDSLPPRWRDHADHLTGAFLGDRRMAGRVLCDWNLPFLDPQCQFPTGELEGRIQTRLGEGDRLAQFETGFTGPFGRKVRQLTIPAWMARGAGRDAAAERLTEEAGRTCFSFGALTFEYDRLGLRPIQPMPAEDCADA